MNLFVVSMMHHNHECAKARLQRRILRDHSNPLEMSDTMFIQYYRVNKDAFRMLLNCIKPRLPASSIPPQIQLAATLRFLADGGFQRDVGKDNEVALGRSTTCKILNRVLVVLEKHVCARWIKLTMTESERNLSKSYFLETFAIPGVIGCIDGTHVEITKPHNNGKVFYNRKGYYSVNTMIICDHNMVIKAVDARRPGSTQDSLIWSVSNARKYFSECYDKGEEGWLLGDAAYELEPFLLTPYRDPQPGSRQLIFNKKHESARKVVARTIGMLKSRFRCLANILPYQPLKAIRIINVCCALHNICRHFNIQNVEEIHFHHESDDYCDELISDSEDTSIRDDIANKL